MHPGGALALATIIIAATVGIVIRRRRGVGWRRIVVAALLVWLGVAGLVVLWMLIAAVAGQRAYFGAVQVPLFAAVWSAPQAAPPGQLRRRDALWEGYEQRGTPLAGECTYTPPGRMPGRGVTICANVQSDGVPAQLVLLSRSRSVSLVDYRRRWGLCASDVGPALGEDGLSIAVRVPREGIGAGDKELVAV